MSIQDERLREMIVGIWRVSDDDEPKRECLGTGIVIAPDSVLTCAHVLAEGEPGSWQPRDETLLLVFDSGTEVRITEGDRALRIHTSLDLAVLTMPELGESRVCSLLSAELDYNDSFRTYGFPLLDQKGYFADGVVSGNRGDKRVQVRLSWAGDGLTKIAGLSGAPLVRAGKVVGVFEGTLTNQSDVTVAETAYALSIREAHASDPDFFGDVPELPVLERLLWLQEGMRRHHVFGNIPCGNAPRVDGFPWLPLEEIYVEPNVSWKIDRENRGSPDSNQGPARTAILSTLDSDTRVTLVEQGFGAGKSLTARTLAWTLSEKFLTCLEDGHRDFYPVFLPCAHSSDVKNLRDLLENNLCEAWASKIGDTSSSELLDLIQEQRSRVLWIIDGLDELGASTESLHGILNDAMSWKRKRPRDRFVVLCRTHTAGVLRAHSSADAWVEGEKLRHFSLLHFTNKQRELWLERWSKLDQPDEHLLEKDKDSLLSDETYNVPLLLLMGTVAATKRNNGAPVSLRGSKVMLYEFFCTWIATGRWSRRNVQPKSHAHQHAAKQIRKVGTQAGFDGLGLVEGWGPEQADDREGVAALLFILSRLAWESVVLEQEAQREEIARDSDVLSADVMARVGDELGLCESELSSLDSVLLSAQGSKSPETRTFLFGHKSFREYLAVRFHLSVFTHMAQRDRASTSEEARTYVEVIGRGDLLDYSDATRIFLKSVGALPTVDSQRRTLRAWCERELHDRTCVGPGPTLQDMNACTTSTNEYRAIWRFAALAIASHTSDPNTPLALSREVVWELSCINQVRRIFNVRKTSRAFVLDKTNIKGAQLENINLTRVSLRHINLSNSNLTCANIDGADLAHADLRSAILCEANLQKSSLRSANLHMAVLIGANMKRASLQKANLNSANLQGANLQGANLLVTDLSGARLQKADLQKANLWNACLPNADLQGANLRGARLPNADLQGVNLLGAKLQTTDFQDANLLRANMRKADLRKADLQRADLRNANLLGTDLRNARLQEAQLQGTDLLGANLSKASLRGANLRGADLRRTNLRGTDLGDTDLQSALLVDIVYDRKTIWPENFDPPASSE